MSSGDPSAELGFPGLTHLRYIKYTYKIQKSRGSEPPSRDSRTDHGKAVGSKLVSEMNKQLETLKMEVTGAGSLCLQSQ